MFLSTASTTAVACRRSFCVVVVIVIFLPSVHTLAISLIIFWVLCRVLQTIRMYNTYPFDATAIVRHRRKIVPLALIFDVERSNVYMQCVVYSFAFYFNDREIRNNEMGIKAREQKTVRKIFRVRERDNEGDAANGWQMVLCVWVCCLA